MRSFYFFAALFVVVLVGLSGASAFGQGTVPVVMISDIHFDPFHNPHAFSQLRAAPIERWPAILDATPDLVEDAERAATEVECRAGGVDTPWPLLKNAMAAARDGEAKPVFVTLSGDLLAHRFSCKFAHLAKGASAQEYSAFAAKTVAFVTWELRQTFPGVPVYVALGNNDSGCGDYRETAGSRFMQSFEVAAAGAAAQGARARSHGARAQVSAEGDYSVALPAPFEHGRLIVLEDVFDAKTYASCSGGADHEAQEHQMAWLRAQLADARTRHEHVWVMGHIPPGVDVFSSYAKYVLRPSEMCSATPKPFLADHALADTLLDYADVIRLAIFAHTHMDEIRLLHRGAGDGGDGKPGVIAAKLVPSVTPFFGNHPAFLVAEVDPKALTLKDWTTYVSPDTGGSAGAWKPAYRFSETYHLTDLSAASAKQLADGFTADRSGKDDRSRVYRQYFYAGDSGLYALGLGQIWPAYACSVREDRVDAFQQCLCRQK